MYISKLQTALPRYKRHKKFYISLFTYRPFTEYKYPKVTWLAFHIWDVFLIYAKGVCINVSVLFNVFFVMDLDFTGS